MIVASFQGKKIYFTIIIGEMYFYCTLLDWRTCFVFSGKVSVFLLKVSWGELEDIVIDMNGSGIVTNKTFLICIEMYLNIEMRCICIWETCCKVVNIIVSTITRRTRLCWMRIDVFRFWRSCGMNFIITLCIIYTFICLGISLGGWYICLLC